MHVSLPGVCSIAVWCLSLVVPCRSWAIIALRCVVDAMRDAAKRKSSRLVWAEADVQLTASQF
jgi:hypothetical protein